MATPHQAPPTGAVTLQCPACPAAPPCPSPVVNLPISGWLPLAVLMAMLWLRACWREFRREKPAEAKALEAPRARRVREAPPPETGEDDPANYENATPVPKQFDQAMKSMGYKAGEIKDLWAKVDPRAPLDQQIVQALK